MFGVLFLLVSRARGVHACIYMWGRGFQEEPEVFQLVVCACYILMQSLGVTWCGGVLEELS